jgi:hypothetical protein
MEDNTLVKSSFSATINAPIEKVDIPSWCFALHESEYQACSPAQKRKRFYWSTLAFNGSDAFIASVARPASQARLDS